MDRCYRPLSESPDGYLATLQDKARREGLACVVNGIIFDAQQRILVLRRAPDLAFLPSHWDLPGGHVEPGESLGAALRREILEETGWQLKKSTH
jgi:8-oxo-dGTP pyrophosphatase MutT (NUDIX family)